MASSPHESKALSVHRTFVVQLHTGTGDGHYSGRVEHVASGRSLHFSSLESLLDFLADNSSPEALEAQRGSR
jgi:hypothetical protein